MLNVGATHLSIASLEPQMEETTNAVFSTSRRVIHDKAKSMIKRVSNGDADPPNGGRTLYTCQYLAR